MPYMWIRVRRFDNIDINRSPAGAAWEEGARRRGLPGSERPRQVEKLWWSSVVQTGQGVSDSLQFVHSHVRIRAGDVV